MPRLTCLRGAYKSNDIAVKGEAMYREGLVKDWVKPRGGFRPETNPRGQLSCTQKEGESDAISKDDPPAGEGAWRHAREMSSSNRGHVYSTFGEEFECVVLSGMLLRGEMSY